MITKIQKNFADRQQRGSLSVVIESVTWAVCDTDRCWRKSADADTLKVATWKGQTRTRKWMTMMKRRRAGNGIYHSFTFSFICACEIRCSMVWDWELSGWL